MKAKRGRKALPPDEKNELFRISVNSDKLKELLKVMNHRQIREELIKRFNEL